MKKISSYIDQAVKPTLVAIAAILSTLTIYKIIKEASRTVVLSLALQFLWNYIIIAFSWELPHITTFQAFLIYTAVKEFFKT